MLDLTSAEHRFYRALADGEYYQALGLARGASQLQVDVAGAQLIERMPRMARDVTRLVNVLGHRRRKAAYDTVRAACDDALTTLTTRHGPEFQQAFPRLGYDLWRQCHLLFHLDLTQPERALDAAETQVLARTAVPRIIRGFLQAHVSRVNFTREELGLGRAARDAWYTKCGCGAGQQFLYPIRPDLLAEPPGQAEVDPPPTQFDPAIYSSPDILCTRCGSMLLQPLRFVERFVFVLPRGIHSGEVVVGDGLFQGNKMFVVAADSCLLDRFVHQAYGTGDCEPDVIDALAEGATLEQLGGELDPPEADSKRPSSIRGQGIWTRQFPGEVAVVACVLLSVAALIAIRFRPGPDAPALMPRHALSQVSPGSPPKLELPDLPNHRYQDLLKRLRQQVGRQDGEKWLQKASSGDPEAIADLQQELERQKTADHRCTANPCPGLRQIQASLDAIVSGQPLSGWTENGKLHAAPADWLRISYKPHSPLGSWLQAGNSKHTIPPEILVQELRHQCVQDGCDHSPGAAAQQNAAVLSILERNKSATGRIENGKAHIGLGVTITPTANAASEHQTKAADDEPVPPEGNGRWK